jgi:2-dehydropantoate 2-reductase
MKILVYGVGVIGSICAMRLSEAGHEATVLARGRRLEELRGDGLRLVEYKTGKATSLKLPVVDSLGEDDAYDLVLVVMQRQQAIEALPALARNRAVSTFLFVGNCAGGSREYVEALGRDRVLLGFVLSGGYFDGGVVRYGVREGGVITTLVGTPDAVETPRLREVADVLKASFGGVEVSPSIDGWLFTHASTIVPMACALYAVGEDPLRLSRTRDVVVIALRAVKELIAAQTRLGLPVLPASLRSMARTPEPLIVPRLARMFENPDYAFEMRHAFTARSEMTYLAGELREAARRAGVSTPNFDRITSWLDGSKSPLPDGSRDVGLDWRGVYVAALGAAVILILLLSWFLR